MKNTIKLLCVGCVFLLGCNLNSCSDMDDHLKYIEGSPKYTGIVDQLMFRSGENRVVFTGLLTSDPKIRQVTIYWNNRKDSILLDVERTSGVDTLFHSIPLPEGRYNFEVITYDDMGIPSITLRQSGSSYGEEYKKALYNRPVKKVERKQEGVVIYWYNGDETSPFVRIEYTDIHDKLQVVNAPISDEETILTNFKTLSQFTMQAYYLPDENAIDTFKVVPQLSEKVNPIMNPGDPFHRKDNFGGKWGLLKDWTYTENMLNQRDDTAGGWSSDAGGVIHLESKNWDGDGVTNGKIYQSLWLPAGKYRLEFYSDGGGSSDFQGNFLIAKGTELPDIDNVQEAIAVHTFDQGFLSGTHSMEFTLDEPETTAIGWVVTFGSSTWMHINSIKLTPLDE